MFANLKFRDVFSVPVAALAPQVLSTGSTGAGVIPVAAALATSAGPAGNYANFKKWVAIVQIGSGGSTNTLINAWWGGASASNGTYSMLPASSTSTISTSATYSQSLGYGGSSVSNYGSAGALVMEIRGEYIGGLGSNITWIRPIVSATNSSCLVSVLSLAFETGQAPASFYDAAYVIQETDAF